MLYYKKRLSEGRIDRYSVEWQLKSTTVPIGVACRARFVLLLSASCEIRNCLPKEEANGIQIKSQIRRRQNI